MQTVLKPLRPSHRPEQRRATDVVLSPHKFLRRGIKATGNERAAPVQPLPRTKRAIVAAVIGYRNALLENPRRLHLPADQNPEQMTDRIREDFACLSTFTVARGHPAQKSG